ncbi:Nucleolar protein 14 [Armadillidium vulgare]|nr:Nucleolar protein 14 [Armadillidium vulgare]
MKKSAKKKSGVNSSSLRSHINPFEVHINRSKHTILGQKTKDDRGLPGVSRTKALKKREKTLQNEFGNRHKSNIFLDKRIGENDAFMDPEKKILMRMIAEKKKQLSKKNLYVLQDENLFHGGKSLSESAMKDKSTFSDEDNDDDLLDANFVKEQHFGGDLFTKAKETDNSGPKSRKDWIEEMIAESKKKKAETKMEKEVHLNAVTKLNESFQSFLKAMKGQTMTDEEKEKSKKKCEYSDYDTYVREFLFDRSKRAQPANRLKTEEELAKEEHERLQKLEDEKEEEW